MFEFQSLTPGPNNTVGIVEMMFRVWVSTGPFYVLAYFGFDVRSGIYGTHWVHCPSPSTFLTVPENARALWWKVYWCMGRYIQSVEAYSMS